MMKTNAAGWDRAFRALVAVAVVALILASDLFAGGLAIVAWTVAVILLATAMVGFCPLYRLMGIDTCRTG